MSFYTTRSEYLILTDVISLAGKAKFSAISSRLFLNYPCFLFNIVITNLDELQITFQLFFFTTNKHIGCGGEVHHNPLKTSELTDSYIDITAIVWVWGPLLRYKYPPFLRL